MVIIPLNYIIDTGWQRKTSDTGLHGRIVTDFYTQNWIHTENNKPNVFKLMYIKLVG